MKRHLLLIMLLLVTVTLSATELYATPNQQTTDNISNATNSTEIAVNSLTTTIIQNSTVNGTVSDNINNQTVNNTTSTLNPFQNSTLENSNVTANIQNSSIAAGDGTYNNVHGIWLSVDDVNNFKVDELIKAGITDVFVKANRLSNPTYQSVLTTIIGKLQGTGIRVHAWITCFRDNEGNWIDPQGTNYKVTVPYTETVKVAYTTWSKTWYKKWYQKSAKKWYKSGRRWKYKLTSIWTYKWKYGWTSTVQYKYETRTAYREETRYNSTQFNDALVNAIADMTRNYAIDGVHLDYVRYPGTAYKHNGAETITAFVKSVHDTIHSIKPKVALSAALMPEGSVNGYYYGQDYEQLSQYLDFLVPMIYKGNYRQDTAWIGRTTAYISSHSNGKPVLAGLQTYISDSDLTPLSASEINQDIQSALSNGASGYALFRYGWLDKAFFQSQGTNNTPATPSFTLKQISDAAGRVKVFIEENQKLPNFVTISSLQVSMPQFLYLLTAATSQANSGVLTSTALKSAADPTGPLEDMKNGTINKSEFVDLASRIKSFMDSNRIAPNYASTSLGKIRYESLIYLYSRVMNYYGANNQLPNYASMKPWTNSLVNPVDPDPHVPDSLKAYLIATKNCQVNDPSIVTLSKSITSGATTAYDKGLRIFNWVRNNLEYSWYYNSQKGAVKALSSLSANCCDHSNLIVALSRAAGVPARYVHGVCTFSSGTYGHVWAQVYANGKWYDADGTSSRNELGTIYNWNTSSWTLKGIYAELPF
ncbi:MAG: pseudomurein-binding repeat-containing protein [Methanobacteriaceae archaeon]|nr:pseudomurein-binding repeat-containing protein [Methanobacteriaceae archaeon]